MIPPRLELRLDQEDEVRGRLGHPDERIDRQPE
jgi:hypothetical protein